MSVQTDYYIPQLQKADEQISKQAAEIARLRKGIQDYLDGNYVGPRAGRKDGAQTRCPHGMFYWDACENCIDEHFAALLKNDT